MLRRILVSAMARALTLRAGVASRSIFTAMGSVAAANRWMAPQRSFVMQQPPRTPPAGSRMDQYLNAVVTDLERKQRERIIVRPNEYFVQLEKVMRMFNDPHNGNITREESVTAIIYLCVMTAHSLPKLSTLEVIRAVQFLFHMSAELGFRLNKDHMNSVMAAIPDPFPKDLERVFPFFIKLVTRLQDPSATEHIRPKVGSLTDKYVSKHKDELKVQDIASIMETWMQIGYKNDDTLKIMMDHVRKYHKILSFAPTDVHVLFYYEATQSKVHDQNYVAILVEKAKEHLAQLDLYLLTNLIAFQKSLQIHDEEFTSGLVVAIQTHLSVDKVQLGPLTYSQLLLAVAEMEGTKGKELLGKVMQHFVKDKQILQAPQNWSPLHSYMLVLGLNAVKAEDKEFAKKVAELLEKTVSAVTPEFVVPMAKAVLKGKLAKEGKVAQNFAAACKRVAKNIRPEDKQALKVLAADHPAFVGFPFQ